MTRHLLRLLLLGLGISYGLSASAQTKISSSAQTKLSGRILDEQRKGVEAAIVLLITSPDSVLVASTLTDSLGHFSLSARKGDFVLCVRNLGYKEARRSLRLESSERLGDIQLEPEAQALEKVVVTARRSRPLTTVTQGKIQLHVAQSYLSDLGSALDVLKHAPGITVSSKGEISLATIGGTALYVNGKKLMLQGEERAAYLRSLSSAKIARIESSPSPNASFGADGAGGIINIILKATEGEGFFLSTSHSAAYWENLRQSSDFALSYNRSKWQLGLNYSHSIGHHAMDYGYEKLQNGDRSVSTTIDTDKRNTYAAGLDFAWQLSPRLQPERELPLQPLRAAATLALGRLDALRRHGTLRAAQRLLFPLPHTPAVGALLFAAREGDRHLRAAGGLQVRPQRTERVPLGAQGLAHQERE